MNTNIQYTQKRFDELEKIDYHKEPIKLHAWKNDKAITQIALIAKENDLSNIKIVLKNLVSENGTIEKSNLKANFIKPSVAYNGEFIGYGGKTGPVPEVTEDNRSEISDIIYSEENISIKKGELRSLWIQIDIPKNAKAGEYKTTIEISADELEENLNYKLILNVQDVELPDSNEFKDNFDIEIWQYPYSNAEYYDVEPFSNEHLEILKPLMEKYIEIGGHAITTTISEEAWGGQTFSRKEIHYPSMVKWKLREDGKFDYDYTDFDKWIEFNKDLGIADKIIIYSLAPWHNSFTYWKDDELIYEEFDTESERYKDVWTEFLKDLSDHLDEKSWFENAYIGIDERGLSHELFDLIESVKNQDGKSFKTAGSMDDLVGKYDLALRMTDLNVGDTAAAKNPKEFTKLVKEREKKEYRTALYSCTGHIPGNFSLCEPVESYYTLVNAAKETAGFLRWAYDAWVENPLEDTTHNSFEPGDTFLIYPDKKNSVDYKAHSSVRLEKMAEAVRDINKIRFIQSKTNKFNNEIKAIFGKIETTPEHRYELLTEDELNSLIIEMNEFKNDIFELTEKYIKDKHM